MKRLRNLLITAAIAYALWCVYRAIDQFDRQIEEITAGRW